MHNDSNSIHRWRGRYPPDELLLELMKQFGSFAAVARETGKAKQNLLAYCDRRPEFKAQMDALVRKPRKWHLPDAAELESLMREHGSVAAVSRVTGIPRSNLWQYIGRRPILLEIVRRYQVKRSPRSSEEVAKTSRLYTPEQKAAQREATRRWNERNPDKAREIALRNRYRRRARTSDNEASLRWLSLLRKDPCSYCGGDGGTVDHIEPLIDGGTNEVENLTGACASCNAVKNSRSLLTFLLERKDE